MGTHESHDWRYIDKTKVYVSAAGTGTAEHLNAKRLPTDAQAKTDFAYLNTDGSANAPYLKA